MTQKVSDNTPSQAFSLRNTPTLIPVDQDEEHPKAPVNPPAKSSARRSQSPTSTILPHATHMTPMMYPTNEEVLYVTPQ